MNGNRAAAGQRWDAAAYRTNAGFVPALGATVLGWLAPQAGEDILDLGCGDGVLTARLAACGARVVGVDKSPDMVAAARTLDLDVRCGDAAALDFAAAFDAVFSNAALHWVRDAPAVLRGVARALRPGGRFVAEFGGAGNCARVRAALHAELHLAGIDPAPVDPWYFPDALTWCDLLRAHGFIVDRCLLAPRPTPLPGDIRDWLETFAGVFLAAVPEPATLFDRVRDRLMPDLYDAARGWHVDYARLRVAAHLPDDARPDDARSNRRVDR